MNVRKALIIILAVFVVYFLVTSPERLADLIGGIWDWIVGAFQSIITFFTSLF